MTIAIHEKEIDALFRKGIYKDRSSLFNNRIHDMYYATYKRGALHPSGIDASNAYNKVMLTNFRAPKWFAGGQPRIRLKDE